MMIGIGTPSSHRHPERMSSPSWFPAKRACLTTVAQFLELSPPLWLSGAGIKMVGT
jgi:hypothetical protein